MSQLIDVKEGSTLRKEVKNSFWFLPDGRCYLTRAACSERSTYLPTCQDGIILVDPMKSLMQRGSHINHILPGHTRKRVKELSVEMRFDFVVSQA